MCIFVKIFLIWGVSTRMDESNLCHSLQWLYQSFVSKEYIKSLTALDMANPSRNCFFLLGENLTLETCLIEKTA